ncbi:MAG: 1,4-alpha-glucan branching protein GlgB [Pirellulales bacterium]|nr:1,4-alpha-glucan branching protein GlgB [Pirellulales bacterium]
MRRIHPAGLFEALCPINEQQPLNEYLLRVTNQRGEQVTLHDPYAYKNTLSDFDLHLLSEGTHWRSYEHLGAQIRTRQGVAGVNFAVWAPNAQGVSVVGDFNEWNGRRHPMRKHANGFWELFIPGLAAGTIYKYRVKTAHDESDRCDPYGFAAEVPPLTASKVADLNTYQWNDSRWLAERERRQGLDAPMNIYEVHLGSWKRPGENPTGYLDYRELARQLVEYCNEMHYTHIELLPVSEHPFSGSWGYQTVGYYAATSRYGSPADFMYFVDLCHQHNIGVILDWVPAHFPRDGHGLRRFDGTALYEHDDPRLGEHPDWGTMIFNYGRNEVRNFLISNALFWLDKYHIDGLRVDAVASMLYLDYSRKAGEWLPNQYGGRENLEAISLLKKFNEEVHAQFPGVLTIAEESTAWPGVSRPTYLGGLGFSLKWNMGWMNDTLRYFRHEPIHRQYHHDELTFSLIYAFHENFVLPLSHDEVVHGKRSLLDQMPGDLWQKFANLRLLYSYMWTHPGKNLLFMGGDIGQWQEWNNESSLDWHLLQWESHQGLQHCVRDLNKLVCDYPALHQMDFDYHGFEWVDCHNYQDSILAYLRKGKNPDDFVLVICNFTPVPRHNYRMGVSRGGWYREIFNSDSQYYGGGNVGNFPGLMAEEQGSHGRSHSLLLTLPPLGVIVLQPEYH